jgi:hypothetical protein
LVAPIHQRAVLTPCFLVLSQILPCVTHPFWFRFVRRWF